MIEDLAAVKRQERALWQGLVVDLAAFLPTLMIALFSRSLLLLSDGVDYIRGFAVYGTSLHILRRIRKGQTASYDYGAGKIECLGSLIGAGVYMIGLLAIVGVSVLRLRSGVPLHTGFTLVGMLIQAGGMAVNGFFWYRNKKIANETHAPLIDMQWRHNRTDTLSCGAVFVALAFMVALRHQPWAYYIDPVCSLIYAVYAISLYLPVVRHSVHDLLDHTLEEDLQIMILRRLAEHFDRYDAFHDVRSRRAGRRVFIQIGLSFDPERRVGEAVDLIQSLKRDLEADIPHSEVAVVLQPPEKLKIKSLDNTSYQFFPLSPTTLEPALNLIYSTFNVQDDEMPREELEESIWPGKYSEALLRVHVSQPRYWVAFKEGRVVGLCGINFNPSEPDAVWGGWLAYENERRKGLSRARVVLLRKVAEEAYATGRMYFRLDTTTEEVSVYANRLYERVGLQVFKTEQHGSVIRLYRQCDRATVEAFLGRISGGS